MKKKLFAALLVVGLGAFAFTSLAGAQVTSTVTSTVKNVIKGFNQKVEINSNGQAQIRGTVVGISANAIMVKSWGGIWTAEVSTGTIILAQGGKAELQNIKSGDSVAVHGRVAEDKAVTVAAKTIKDYSFRLNSSDEEARKKLEKSEEVKKKAEGNKGEVKSWLEKIKSQLKRKGGSEDIKVSGSVTCLPKKNPGEVQTMECALGIQADGKNYGLLLEDGLPQFEVGNTVSVSGKLIPAKNSIYNIVGTIKVSN